MLKKSARPDLFIWSVRVCLSLFGCMRLTRSEQTDSGLSQTCRPSKSTVLEWFFSILLKKKCRRILRSCVNLGTTATLCLYEIYRGRAFQLTKRPSPGWSDELTKEKTRWYLRRCF